MDDVSHVFAVSIGLLLGAGCLAAPPGDHGDDDDDDDDDAAAPCDEYHPDRTVGLLFCSPEAADGYTLFAPMLSSTTWLIDMYGNAVHSWEAERPPAASAYLLDDGSILRPTQHEDSPFGPAIAGGMIERIGWDGAVQWRYELATPTEVSHHDVAILPNGNLLILALEKKTAEEAVAAGRAPDRLSPQNDMHPDWVLELDPVTREVVWEWHLWDHVVQNRDPSLPNYGPPWQHPERLDLSAGEFVGDGDWAHVNSIDYNEELDQILLSSAFFDEIWVIDHSTTTAEAASHEGGRSGMGGDFLYRWGHPDLYGAAAPGMNVLDSQHGPGWIPPDLPGAGNILVFNNGGRDGASTVLELEPPLSVDGSYRRAPGQPYGPTSATWSYATPDLFSPIASGVQRLANGNTLICEGASGRLVEVTAEGKVVWEYRSPDTADGPVRQGDSVPIVATLPAGTIYQNMLFRAQRIPAGHPGLARLLASSPAGARPIELDPN